MCMGDGLWKVVGQQCYDLNALQLAQVGLKVKAQ